MAKYNRSEPVVFQLVLDEVSQSQHLVCVQFLRSLNEEEKNLGSSKCVTLKVISVTYFGQKKSYFPDKIRFSTTKISILIQSRSSKYWSKVIIIMEQDFSYSCNNYNFVTHHCYRRFSSFCQLTIGGSRVY